MTNARPGYPILLVLYDPLQCGDSVLLFEDLLLELVQMFQDQPHINNHLVDVLSMTIDSSSDKFKVNLSLVISEHLLLLNDVSPDICFQSIALKEQSVHGSKHGKVALALTSNWRCLLNILIWIAVEWQIACVAWFNHSLGFSQSRTPALRRSYRTGSFNVSLFRARRS